MNEIQLPDYLPSRYTSWLHLYSDILKSFTQKEIPITEETVVNLAEFDREFHDTVFYQSFPITLIKSRALDFIYSKLPHADEINRIRSIVHQTTIGNYDLMNALNKLLDLSLHTNN